MIASRIAAPPARWLNFIGRACTHEGLTTARALLAVWLIRFALGRVPFERLGAAVERLARSGRRREAGICTSGAARVRRAERIVRVVHGVNRAARHVDGATCLTRALAAQALLGLSGVESQLKFGVGRDAAGAFRAHAWVECDGRVVIGGGEELNGLVALDAWPG